MIDNKKVSDKHQKGIERVKMRKGELGKGQGGKMGIRAKEKGNFKRANSAATPRKA